MTRGRAKMDGEERSREDRRAPERETQVYGCHRHRRSRHEICDLNRTTGETARGVSRTGWGGGLHSGVPAWSGGGRAGAVAALNSSPRNLSLQCRRDGRTSGLPTCRGGRGWRGSSECLAVRQTPPVHLVGALFSTVIFYHISF